MTTFPRKFIALVALDAITIIVAAALLLRNFLHTAMAIMAILFVVNFFLGPSTLRLQKGEATQILNRGRSKLWFWGFALLASALVRLAFLVQSGFSWLGIIGIAGVLLGIMFLVIAAKSKVPIY